MSSIQNDITNFFSNTFYRSAETASLNQWITPVALAVIVPSSLYVLNLICNRSSMDSRHVRKHPKTPEEYLKRAQENYKAKRYTESIRLAKAGIKCTEKKPEKKAELYLILAKSELKDGSVRNASDAFIKGLKSFPGDSIERELLFVKAMIQDRADLEGIKLETNDWAIS